MKRCAAGHSYTPGNGCPTCARTARQDRYRANKALASKQNREYREKNRDKIKAQRKRHYAANHVRIKESKSRYYHENKRTLNQKNSIYRARNRDKVKLQQRDAGLRRTVGISLSDYNARYRDIGGKCEVCGVERPASGQSGLRADHDHSTGLFRGLVCGRCNIMLAALDDADWREQAERYIGGHALACASLSLFSPVETKGTAS